MLLIRPWAYKGGEGNAVSRTALEQYQKEQAQSHWRFLVLPLGVFLVSWKLNFYSILHYDFHQGEFFGYRR